MANYERLLRVALGEAPADVVITGGLLVNVLTREIYPATVGICEDTIAYVTGAEDAAVEGAQVVDARGCWLTPGLIDAHMHIESTHATPQHFADAVLPRGVTCVAQDPHEMANVLGLEGVHAMRRAAVGLPLRVLTLASTCVPSVPRMETSGAEFGAAEIDALLDEADVIGLAEVMDFWGVIRQKPRVTEIVKVGRARGALMTGHIRQLGGRELNTYLAAGIDSDHEQLDAAGILARSRLGMTVEICCCQARDTIPAAVEAWRMGGPLDAVVFVTDDIPPQELISAGHLDQGVRRAIQLGMPAAEAVRAATLLPARRLRQYDLGLIAPGRKADILLIDDLNAFHVAATLVNGRWAARGGQMLEPSASTYAMPESALHSVHVPRLSAEDFAVAGRGSRARARVLAQRGRALHERLLPVRAGQVWWQDQPDLALVSVRHRHGRTQDHASVLLEGCGLQRGALATTYAHDAHNLVVVGRDPGDMAAAANALREAGGGYAAVCGGQVLALAALPVAGILADRPVAEIAVEFAQFCAAAGDLGVSDQPLKLLTSLPLPVVPAFRPTDRGLVDVQRQAFIPAFEFLDEDTTNQEAR